ncbi:hypothetical protein [Streptomyces sp. NPDC002889]|uniref:hypothetical protein n=1 Tax=Streptomyces sp. NPDC002889 TaxID=3364669 RepID=UPI0036AEA834
MTASRRRPSAAAHAACTGQSGPACPPTRLTARHDNAHRALPPVDVQLALDARININQLSGDYNVDPATGKDVSLEELADRLTEHGWWDSKHFELTMTDGQVAKVHEIWRP